MKNQTQVLAQLTSENAHNVSTVINLQNPEWGTKIFNFNEQPLNEGKFAHTVGSGSNSSVLFDSQMKFWGVASFKSN